MMAKRFGGESGNSSAGPLRTRRPYGLKSQRGTGALANIQEFEAEAYGWSPRTRVDLLEDFVGGRPYFELFVPLYDVTNDAHTILVGANSRGSIEIPRGGYLVEAQLVAEDALAKNDTNYLTFSVTNTLATGSGSTAMLVASDVNTTKVTLGTAISAVIGRSLTVHATAANLNVAKGDVVTVLAAVTGTLDNAVDKPILRLRFATVPDTYYTPRIVRTAGSPRVGPVTSTANGAQIMQLSATNEVNLAGIDFDDELQVHPQRGWRWEAWVKVTTIAANERAVFGLASAYNAALDTVQLNAWFRVDGSMALTVECDDDTTNQDDQSTDVTLVTDTYAYFRIEYTVEGTVRFWHNDAMVKELTATFPATPLMQGFVAVQKDSGTGVPSCTVDLIRSSWDRF